MEEDKNIMLKVKQKAETLINEITEEGIDRENIKVLGELVDIHKDISNEEYWKKKEENYMRYRSYGNEYGEEYGRRGVPGTGRRYRVEYGRRGVPGTGRGRYRGEDMLDEMKEMYGEYAENNEYGNYGGQENMELIEAMSASLMDFVDHLKKNAKSPEEKQLIDQKLQELARM